MKKIIVAIDGLKFSTSAVQYAAQLTQETNGHLVGIFLEDFTYHSYSIYNMAMEGGPINERMNRLADEDKSTREHSVNQFEEICRMTGINHSVHRDENFALPQLLHESIYADVLVIDKRETLTRFGQDMPSDFMRELLINVACPVVAIPGNFELIEKVVLLYDGEPSSVYAIKMFSYLFPSFKVLPTEVLSVKNEDQTLHLPDNRLMKEFMKRHYPEATYKVLQGDPEKEIVKYLKNQHQDELVVLGAYRRNTLSRWFKASMADVLMQELKTPLFIAHNK